MKLQIKKINSIIPLKVCAQACTNNCQETIWAGRTAAEGWKGHCWSTIGYTARAALW